MEFTASVQAPSFRKRKRRGATSKATFSALSSSSTSGSSLSLFASSTLKNDDKVKPTTAGPLFAKPSLASVAQARKQHEDALALDPAIFDYDASLPAGDIDSGGDLKSRTASHFRHSSNATEESGGGSRYISTMLIHAEKRKEEQERAFNRMQRRKADEEAAIYGDTEKFVTAAYKAQMRREVEADQAEQQQEINDKASRIGTGVGSFLSNVMQNSISQEPDKLEQRETFKNTGASNDPVGSLMPQSSSSSASSTLKDVFKSHEKAVCKALPQQELALASYHARKEEERLKTAEKIAAARARYFLRKDKRKTYV